MLNYEVYLGKNDNDAGAGLVQAHGLGYYVVTTMVKPFYKGFIMYILTTFSPHHSYWKTYC